jgi:hypothetical protein
VSRGRGRSFLSRDRGDDPVLSSLERACSVTPGGSEDEADPVVGDVTASGSTSVSSSTPATFAAGVWSRSTTSASSATEAVEGFTNESSSQAAIAASSIRRSIARSNAREVLASGVRSATSEGMDGSSSASEGLTIRV